MISGWSDGHIRCHSTRDSSLRWTLHDAHRLQSSIGVSAISLGYMGNVLISGGVAGDLRAWVTSNRGLVSHMKQHSVSTDTCTLRHHYTKCGQVLGVLTPSLFLTQAAVTAIETFTDNVHFVSSSKDGAVRVWDFVKEKCLSTFTGKMGGINDVILLSDQVPCILLSPCGAMINSHCCAVFGSQVQIISVGKDRCITYWDVRCPYPQNIIPGAHDGEITAACVNLDESIVATGGSDKVGYPALP